MLLDNELSSRAVVQGYPDPVKQPGDFLVDWERAGIALQDPSQGLLVQLWKLEVERDTANIDQWHFMLSAPNHPKQTLFSYNDVTEASLSFDQNMNPFVAFMAAGNPFIYWYDSAVPGQVVAALPAGIKSPRCTIDDKRLFNSSNSDNLLAYVRAGNLCVRYQRDRYTIEYVLCAVGANAELISCAMTAGMRVQFRVRKVTAPVDNDMYKVVADPYLSDIVSDMCLRVGISPEDLDVNELYSDNVVGYLVASDEGVAESMKPLSQAFFFDPTEYDRKLRFLRRGRAAAFSFTYDDLVEASPNAMKQTRVDETKLPKRVDVNHLDPEGGFAKNKQTSYRKSNLVQAKGSETLEFGFGMYADQAASISLKYIKMKWHEQMTYEWALPLAFTRVMPGDVGIYTDRDGSLHRIRVEERNEADGVLKFKGKLDGGAAVYETQAPGLSLPPPTSTTPGLVGETRLEILNLPPLRDQDDELGVYIAMAGSSAAWYGAALEVSTDGGINYVEAFQNEIPATLGETETALLAETTPTGFSPQSLVVTSNFALESTTYDTLLTNFNRAVVGDEVIQFQNAVSLGDNKYLLTGIIRGRYNTVADEWPAGTRFVLIDTSLVFLQAQSWMLGKELMFKPVSFGTPDDDAVPTAYDYDVVYSQREWAPHYVHAVRDGSSNVAVSWIGRGRLGIDTAPRAGKYFTGYKVRFSDGHEATVNAATSTYTRSSTPAGVTVQVCGTNSLVGDGDFSEAAAT